ncbi:MAG: hypothetical protein PHW65_06990 [Dehalococcoidales bacterium]|nr:hypothetical protein [Dehalococcoidales bacterium]
MKLVSSKPQTRELLMSIDDFSGGTNSLIEEARMSSKFAVESTNMMQVQDGVWKTRWGTNYYGTSHAANPDGACEYLKSDGTTELITIANGKAWKSTDGGSLTEITGATFTAGKQCYFLQIAGYLYIANGTDPLARYNGSTLTTYTQINAPTNLTASITSGLSSGVYTYYAEVTALNEVGETTGSTEASIKVNKMRDNWIAGTDKVTWSWSAVAGADRYQLYLADESGYETLLTSVEAGTTSFTDDGTLDLNPYVEVPLQNTTAAPKFTSMCISNNRIWATNNSDSKYTVYFSGTGQFIGNFSDFYGGGWINLEKGGREIPVAVKHYQSGSGEGMATVLCKTPDGRGAVWQLGISTATVGDTSFSVPSAIKVVGSFGTESLLGVVATENDIAFPNRKGWFNLGPEKNYYGLLRTRERSSNIRPYWRSLFGNQIKNICAYFYDAKIFISVPQSSSGNDRMIVFDTERGNWTVDWSIGAKQFLEYTDSNGQTHLLYIPLTGTRLIELSENFSNDLGVPFYQSYISPLLSVSKRKTDILNLREVILELGHPKGAINFQVLGISKNSNFTTLATATIANFGANTGVGTDLAGDFFASSTNDNSKEVDDTWTVYFTATPTTYTQAITKKAIKKRAKVYALQFKVSSSTANTDYSILSLQARGRLVPGRTPSAWVS